MKISLDIVKLFLNHFDKHKIQGRIAFICFGISLVAFSVILAFYVGQSFYDLIIYR